jgi:hypothetical protein
MRTPLCYTIPQILGFIELIDEDIEGYPDAVVVGIENECSSHFSACRHLNLRIASALVVRWSRDHVTMRFFLHKDKEVTDKDTIRSSTGTSYPHGGTVDRGGTWLQDMSAEDG